MAKTKIKVVIPDRYYEKATEFEVESQMARLPIVFDKNNREEPWQQIDADDLEEGDGTDGFIIEVIPWRGIYMVQPYSDMMLNGLGEGELIPVPIVGLVRTLDSWVGNYGG